jgi:hypothetical protein
LLTEFHRYNGPRKATRSKLEIQRCVWQALRLGNNDLHKLKAFGCQALFGFLSLFSITELYLERNNLGLMSTTSLIELGKACENIKYLKLLNFFAVLGNACGKFKNLRTLFLAKNKFNQLTDEFFQHSNLVLCNPTHYVK